MEEEVIYPVVVIGQITTVAKELVNFFKKDPSCELLQVDSFENARAHIQRFPHCIVVGSIESKEQLGATLGLLKALNLKATRDRVKVLLVGKSNFAYLSEVMRALFVADYIIEPAAAKTVAFKARLQLNTLKIAVASGATKKEEISRTFNKTLATDGEKEQDSFRFKGKKAPATKEKFLIEDAAAAKTGADGSDAVVSNDLDAASNGLVHDRSAEGPSAYVPEWKQNIVGEGKVKDPAYEQAKISLYEKARTAAAAAKILKSDANAEAVENSEIKATHSSDQQASQELSANHDEATPAALSLLKKLSGNKEPTSASKQKSASLTDSKPGRNSATPDAKDSETAAAPKWNAKITEAQGADQTELDLEALANSKVPERKPDQGFNADRDIEELEAKSNSGKKLSAQEKEKIKAIAKKESERVQNEKVLKARKPSAKEEPEAAKRDLSRQGALAANELEKRSDEEDSEFDAAVEKAKLETLKSGDAPEEKIVSEQLRGVFQRLAAKSEIKKKELEKARVQAAEIVRVAQLQKKEKHAAEVKEVKAEIQRTRAAAQAKTEAKRKGKFPEVDNASLEVLKTAKEKNREEQEEFEKKRGRSEDQNEAELDDPEFNELKGKRKSESEADYEPDTFSPDIANNTSSTSALGSGDEAKNKITAKDSDVSDPEVVWRAQKAALEALKKITWFYRNRTEVSMLPGSWVQTDDGYYFLRKKIATDGIRILQEALPLWIYQGKFAPDIHADGLRWRFREIEPIRIVSSADLPAAILENLSQNLIGEESAAKGLSAQAKNFKKSFENGLEAESVDADSEDEEEVKSFDAFAELDEESTELGNAKAAKKGQESGEEEEDIFGRKALRKKEAAEAAAEELAVANTARKNKSESSETEADLQLEPDFSIEESLKEVAGDQEESEDGTVLDFKSKKSKGDADEMLVEAGVDKKKPKKRADTEDEEEILENNEILAGSKSKESDSDANISDSEEQSSAAEGKQRKGHEESSEDIYGAGANAKLRQDTEQDLTQDAKERGEAGQSAANALDRINESAAGKDDSDSFDLLQEKKKKKRRGILTAIKEKLSPKFVTEMAQEKASKKKEAEEALLAKEEKRDGNSLTDANSANFESPLSEVNKKKFLEDLEEQRKRKEAIPESLSGIVPSASHNGASGISDFTNTAATEVVPAPSSVQAAQTSIKSETNLKPSVELAAPESTVSPASSLYTLPIEAKLSGAQAVPLLAGMLGQAIAAKQQNSGAAYPGDRAKALSRFGNNHGLSLAEAMARALNEGRKRRGSDLSLVADLSGNRLATSLALAQISKNKFGKMAIFRVVNEFCSSHLPMIKNRCVEYRSGYFFYKDGQFNDEKKVAAWEIAERIRQQGAALRELHSIEGSLLILCETHEPIRSLRENEIRLINQIGNSYTVNVSQVQSEKQIVA